MGAMEKSKRRVGNAALVCGTLLVLAASVAVQPAVAGPLAITQLTFTTGCANGSLESGAPALGADGSVTFQSNCDLTGADAGGNADGNPEVFRFGTVTNTLSQITASSGCNNGDIAYGAPASNTDGTAIALVSSCDLTGDNPDGNFELFRYAAAAGTLTQVTRSAGCSNFAPAVAADGSLAFASSCDLTGDNPDGNTEIFHFDSWANSLAQVTSSTGCTGSSDPAISSDGSQIVMVSNCDLTGGNADENHEIFRFDVDTNTLTQVTSSSGCSGSAYPTISADGARIAFASGCDLTGQNGDGNTELFAFDTAAGTLTQITNSSGCLGSFDPGLSADGTRMVFASTCDLTGDNPAGNWEIFQYESTRHELAQITSSVSSGCLGSFAPTVSADGRRIAFKSYCDLTGGNADHNLEIFLAQPRLRRLELVGRRSGDSSRARRHLAGQPRRALVRH